MHRLPDCIWVELSAVALSSESHEEVLVAFRNRVELPADEVSRLDDVL